MPPLEQARQPWWVTELAREGFAFEADPDGGAFASRASSDADDLRALGFTVGSG